MAHHGVNIHILNRNFPLLRRGASEDRRFEQLARYPVLGMLERSTENGRVHEEVVVGLGTKIAKLRELVD